MTTAEGAEGRRGLWRLDWSAVITGVLVALAAHIVLGLIGAALGLAAEPADSRTLGAGAAVWALLTPFVATLGGAWLACRMAGTHEDRTSAALHGVLVWCIGLIAGALFLTGTIATGAMSAGAASSGNLRAAAQLRGDVGPSAGDRAAPVPRQEDAARGAAASTAGAALASIAGLLGAISGAALSGRRREGRGLGWRIAIQRRDERVARAGSGAGERGYAGTYPPEGSRAEQRPGEVPPSDPYHH
jgi:hypothetical protein